jgi:membrane protein YdbS with pleckstrin-like domain
LYGNISPTASHPNLLLIQRGVLWRTETRVPRTRIQHTDVSQGPLERSFGLATLVVHTAGTRFAVVDLPGLLTSDAEALRDALLGAIADDDVLTQSADWRQLHPSSMIFTAWKSGMQFLPALVFALLAGNTFLIGAQFFGAIAVLIALAHAFAYQALYRYQLGNDELVVREGVLSRTVRHVPYHRIQNVNLVQNLLHRALGVYRVQLESASGDKPEAVMPALSAAAVEELQARDRRRPQPRRVKPTTWTTARPSWSLGPGEVVRLGLVSWRGLVVAGAIAGFFFQFGEQLPIWSSIGERIGDFTEADLGRRAGSPATRPRHGRRWSAAVLVLLTDLFHRARRDPLPRIHPPPPRAGPPHHLRAPDPRDQHHSDRAHPAHHPSVRA